jgi:hypothetical protein
MASGCVVAGESPSPSSLDSAATISAPPPIASVSHSPEASTAPTATPEPSVGPAPSSAWTEISWRSVSASLGVPATASSNLSVYGWSGGFLAFNSDDPNMMGAGDPTVNETIYVSRSTDGVHWTAGQPLDTTGFQSDIAIVKVVEGPAGLLAIGTFFGVACGGPPTVQALWTSTDGLSWARVNMAAQFGTGPVWSVDAGSTGYVATGDLADGKTQVIWLSDDGMSWRRVAIPTATFGTVVVQGATAFASGYVVSGAVLGDEGCGGPRLMTPSLWWSSDGKSWSRAKLAGTTAAPDAWMKVFRISDRVVVAIQTSWDAITQVSSTAAWTSTDGKTWALLAGPPAALSAVVYTDGRRCIFVGGPSESNHNLTLTAARDDLTTVDLTQTGEMPSDLENWHWVAALGPTGLLVVSMDGAHAWLGLPTSH